MIFYLTIQNLKKLIKEHIVIFIIIVLGLAVSTFGMLFFSGYFADSYYKTLQGEVCSIQLSINSGTNSGEIENVLSSLTNIEKGNVISVVVSNSKISSSYVPQSSIPVIGKYSVSDKERILLGHYYNSDENSPVVLISEQCASMIDVSSTPINQLISIGGNQLTIIGILISGEIGYIVPVNYYVNHYPVTNIKISFNQKITRDEFKSIVNAYPKQISNYELNYQASPFFSVSFLPQLVQILLIFSFTFINIVMIISLWQKYYIRQYKIYYICGCTKTKTFSVISVQIIILSIISIIFGLLLYLVCLSKFELLGLVSEKINDCFLMCFYILLLIIVFAVVLSKKIVNNLGLYKIEE